MQNRGDVIEAQRVDFKDGGTLDGPLLSQILYRIKAVENKTNLEYEVYKDGTPLNVGLVKVLVFATGLTVQSTEFVSAPIHTMYRFGNTSKRDVHIGDGSKIILSIVPGEFVKLVKLPTGAWFGTFGP